MESKGAAVVGKAYEYKDHVLEMSVNDAVNLKYPGATVWP